MRVIAVLGALLISGKAVTFAENLSDMNGHKTLLFGVLRSCGRIDLSIGAFVKETVSYEGI